MIHALMAGKDKTVFSEIETILADNQIMSTWCGSGKAALSKLSKSPDYLVIVDENLPDMTGPAFVENLVLQNPMTNCVVASALSSKKFHEVYEGFGVLMQFPDVPGKKDALKLIKHLELIFQLHGQNSI